MNELELIGSQALEIKRLKKVNALYEEALHRIKKKIRGDDGLLSDDLFADTLDPKLVFEAIEAVASDPLDEAALLMEVWLKHISYQ